MCSLMGLKHALAGVTFLAVLKAAFERLVAGVQGFV